MLIINGSGDPGFSLLADLGLSLAFMQCESSISRARVPVR